MPPKVLVIGAIEGNISKALEKISKLHAKTDFSFAIIVGDLFSPPAPSTPDSTPNHDITSLLNNTLPIPLPIYFTLGSHSLPPEIITRLDSSTTNEVCPNLIYLGRKGTLKTSDGIRIVALGGKFVQNDASVTHAIGKYDPLYLEADVKGLYGAHSADILATNQWPANITSGSHNAVPETLRTDEGVQPIAELCAKLRPRYHFCSSPAATWDREPFKHPVEYGSLDVEPVTRFRSLAGLSAGSAKDWMSAFNLDPSGPPPPAPNATPSPFTLSPMSRKRPREDQPESFARFSNGKGHSYSGRPPTQRHRGPANPDDCFMCVNKPDFNAHMLVSIGNESLTTVPRGPLPLPTTFPDLSSSGHVLIIPTYHAGDDLKNGSRPQGEIDVEFAEMMKFRKALCAMTKAKAQGRLGAVCWEANRTGVRHLHWQFMAAPYELVKKGLVEAGFRALSSNIGMPPFKACDPDSRLELAADFFRLWIWTPHVASSDPVEAADEIRAGGDGDSEKSIFFPIPADQRFNLQFGREVMAKLLRLGDRLDWRAAQQPYSVEENDAVALRADFEDFDFAMNADAAEG